MRFYGSVLWKRTNLVLSKNGFMETPNKPIKVDFYGSILWIATFSVWKSYDFTFLWIDFMDCLFFRLEVVRFYIFMDYFLGCCTKSPIFGVGSSGRRETPLCKWSKIRYIVQ